MRRIFGKVIFFGLLVLSSMGVVHAQILYSTLPADPDGGPCFGGGNLAAVEMATPTGAPYQINGATVRMHHASDVRASPWRSIQQRRVPGTLRVRWDGCRQWLGTMDLYNLTLHHPLFVGFHQLRWPAYLSIRRVGDLQRIDAERHLHPYVAENPGGSWTMNR